MNHIRRGKLVNLRNELEALSQEEEAAFFNLPDSLQQSAKGLLIEANYEALQEVVETLDGVIGSEG